MAVNEKQIRLYHAIGCDIMERQNLQGWGSKVIKRLSADLRESFPEMKGLSVSNLKYMRLFAQECPNLEIGQQSADQLPWFHIVILLTKLLESVEREWYAIQAIEQGWTRSTLEVQIKNRLFDRQGAALTNFDRHLESSQANLAAQILKDPYHCKLEHTGQLNFYLGAVDAQMKGVEDRSTIGLRPHFVNGLLLCKTKNRLVAEYALAGTNRPMGIAKYELVRALPEPLDRSLPSIEEIEAEFAQDLEDES